MVTREQLLEALPLIGAGDDFPSFAREMTESEHHEWFRGVVRLALLAIDGERDRKLGEAVIASGITAEWCEKHLRDLRNARGSMSLSSPAYGRAFTQEIALFGALVPALRGEP